MLPNRTTADVTFWYQWVVANLLGELIGLGSVAAFAYMIIRVFGEPATTIGILMFGLLAIGLGALEGLVVGYAQARVLRHRLPALRRWVEATVMGAVLAWTLGMLPSTVMSLVGPGSATTPPVMPSDAIQLLLAIPLGLVTGAILGLPQWRVLRRHVSHAGWWVLANGVAWGCGMPLVFSVIGSGTIDNGAMRIIWLVSGIALAGAVVGAIHGAFLVWLLKGRATEPGAG